MKKINYCKRCLFPDVKPDLVFDKEGICDACRSADRKHDLTEGIHWNDRADQFASLINDVRSKKAPHYDCVVPVSGGKDSCWQTYAASKLHGLRVLAVTFDQFDQTPTGRSNLEVLRNIGVDHLHFTLNPLLVKKLVWLGFELVGDPYWVNHVGMFTVPFNIASSFAIPLIIYGENPQFEYGGPKDSRDNWIMDKRWRQEFGGMRGLREDDLIDHGRGIREEDLSMLRFPELARTGQPHVQAIFYGHFFKWDIACHLPVVRSLGWQELPSPPQGSWLTYENCDMRFIDIRERIKFLKYGYGRASDQLNIEIRAGRIDRDIALEYAMENDGNIDQANVDKFCEYLSISHTEFDRVTDSFVNEDLFERSDDGTWELRNPRQ